MIVRTLLVIFSLLFIIACSNNKGLYYDRYQTGSVSEELTKTTIANLNESGIDLSKTHQVDFQISVDTKRNANKIIKEIRELGYTCHLYDDSGEERQTVECSKEIIIEVTNILESLKQIDFIAWKHNGYEDGWGVLTKNNR